MSYDHYQDPSQGGWSGPPYAVSPAGPVENPYPPAPNRPNTVLIVVVTVLTTLVVSALVVCGLGTFGVVLIGASADSSTSASPSSSSSSASPKPSATASPGGELVRPAGAPFSYRMPVGFHSQPAPTSSGGPTPTDGASPQAEPLTEYYETWSAPTGGSVWDYLYVASFPLTENASDGALTTRLDTWVTQIGQDPSTRAAVKVGKYSAYKYSFADAAKGAWDYFVYDGRTVVDVTCSWSSDQVDIQRGCQELLKTLTVTG
ncbi:hypothetical protein [Cryptosporangium phraense]|uniref:Uncharacterized protein n=1 Tax=Cryptosporangium phraense TaxID=2593070 RepID=A0A545AWA9_9ACTN|nr:hypothetical protein [Cryptosporangium phraense]TQS45608.1 hypothetical protein FL583_07710 [Cryptosporangium phraense]